MSGTGLPSPETVSALLIVATIFHALALILTSFRLWFRYHIRRFWWDDIWAALALLSDAVCMVVMWTLTAPLDDPYVNVEALPTPALSPNAHVVSYWLNILAYTCSIWFARLSIVLSIVRVVPPSRCVASTVVGAGAVFLCMWAYMMTCKSVVCSLDKSWYDSSSIQCPIPKWVALSEVSTDAVSDFVLVILPFRLLWGIKLPSNQRIMVLSVFSASILVSVVSAVHTSYLIPHTTFTSGIVAELGGAISLIVCNLLVLVTFLYRVMRNGRDLTAGISGNQNCKPRQCAHAPAPGQESSNQLTTVDLEYAGSSWFASTGATVTVGTGTAFTATNVSSVVFAGAGGDVGDGDNDMVKTVDSAVAAGRGGPADMERPLASVTKR